MGTDTVQSDGFGPQYFLFNEMIRWKRVVSTGMIGLIQSKLKIDWFIVQSNVREICTGQIDNRDLSHAKVGIHNIVFQAGFNFI